MSGTEIDVAVIGAGVVGLAVARELTRRGRAVAVLERNRRPGQETSSRHSGVLHAGLYYPTGSLKARLCVEGRRELVELCRRRDVGHSICGKLIVATTLAEEEGLHRLLRQGRDNGVEGLRLVTSDEVRQREPTVSAAAGLLSEATGIVSSDELTAALERSVLDRGGVVLCRHEVIGLEPAAGGWSVAVRPGGGEPYTFATRHVVNAAGLWCAEVAALAGEGDLDVHYCKGDYFWTTRPAVRGLVYPLPDPGLRGLGIHATVDLAGRIRFGPDAAFVDDLQYDVDAAKAVDFARAVARYIPSIGAGDLQPDTAGIRPKLVREDEFHDFVVRQGESGLVTLAGIESPGLTSCLALGRHTADLLLGSR